MRSMTGYGRGSATRAGNRVTIEISAVNSRKQADIRFALPRELAALEPVLRGLVQQRVHRGSLTVTLAYELAPEHRVGKVRIDEEVGAHVVAQLRELARQAGIGDEIKAGDLLAVPGVVVEDLDLPTDEIESLAAEAVTEALAETRRMQQTEGDALRADLEERHAELQRLVQAILERSDEAVSHYRDRLKERIEKLDVELSVDDERLAKEVAFFADKSDITEELVRLQSHLSQFKELFTSDEPAGKAMEFLSQEMNREASTICAKTRDTKLIALGLALKNELNRVREQILNIE